jgi:hypothetical protein
VREIPFRFRPPAATGLITAHSSQPLPLLPGEFVPLRVGSTTDFRRRPSIVASGSERRARSFALLVVVRPPLRPLIDTLFIDD